KTDRAPVDAPDDEEDEPGIYVLADNLTQADRSLQPLDGIPVQRVEDPVAGVDIIIQLTVFLQLQEIDLAQGEPGPESAPSQRFDELPGIGTIRKEQVAQGLVRKEHALKIGTKHLKGGGRRVDFAQRFPYLGLLRS